MTTMTPEVARPAQPRRTPVGPILLLVFGSLVALLAMGLLAGGGAVVWADTTQRDADGWFATSAHRFATPTYALSEEGIDLQDWPTWLVEPGDLGRVRISARNADGKPIFVGIARERDVDAYLATVGHDEVTSVDYEPFEADYSRTAGGAPKTAPARARIWAASATGRGAQTVTWNPSEGSWAAVVMNADGSRGVHADVSVGAKVSHLGWIAVGLIAGGALLLIGGAAMIFFGGRGLSRGR
jgi:hypothetical protein